MNLMKPFRIEVHQEGDKFLARVLQEEFYDQREGISYKTIAVALGNTPGVALIDATREAFKL